MRAASVGKSSEFSQLEIIEELTIHANVKSLCLQALCLLLGYFKLETDSLCKGFQEKDNRLVTMRAPSYWVGSA